MNNKYSLPNYKVLTNVSVIDMEDEPSGEFFAEQDNVLKTMGITNDWQVTYLVHFFNSSFFDESVAFMDIADAIECLAIKEGADVVQFENGNIGFVAYYGNEVNGFEVISTNTVKAVTECLNVPCDIYEFDSGSQDCIVVNADAFELDEYADKVVKDAWVNTNDGVATSIELYIEL